MWFKDLLRRLFRRRRVPKVDSHEEERLSHACAAESFMPVAAWHTRGFVGRGSERDLELIVFEGLFCSSCRRALCCAACGKTPEAGAVFDDVRGMHEDALICCPAPKSKYVVRKSVPKMPEPPDPDGIAGEIWPKDMN